MLITCFSAPLCSVTDSTDTNDSIVSPSVTAHLPQLGYADFVVSCYSTMHILARSDVRWVDGVRGTCVSKFKCKPHCYDEIAAIILKSSCNVMRVLWHNCMCIIVCAGLLIV